jgi:putative holliday junction resolvase
LILGVDPGGRRFGIAIADPETRFARPLEVLDATIDDPVARIVELARENNVTLIVVGKPLTLSGREGNAVDAYRRFVASLEEAGLPVEQFDERLTSIIAEQGLRGAGMTAREMKEKKDAVAAQVLLQDFLDSRS